MLISNQFFIKIDGHRIEVSEEVYRAYKRPAWTERKRREVRSEFELSLDLMEDSVIDSMTLTEDALLDRFIISDALSVLEDNDFALIYALFFDGLTERDYALQNGTSQQNINQRKNRVLKKLKLILST